jgi:hypothetical protein
MGAGGADFYVAAIDEDLSSVDRPERADDLPGIALLNLTRTSAGVVIDYAIPSDGPASLTVYDVLGREVRDLFDGRARAGNRTSVWDERDYRGERVASGVYVIRLRAGQDAATGKTVIIR